MVRCGACLRIFAADDNLLPSVDIRTVTLPTHEEDDTLDDEVDTHEEQLPLADLTSADDETQDNDDTESIFTLDLADSLPNRVSPIISENSTSWHFIDEDSPEPTPEPEPEPEPEPTSATIKQKEDEEGETATNKELTREEAPTAAPIAAFTATNSFADDDVDALARTRLHELELSRAASPKKAHHQDLEDFSVDDLDNIHFDENPLELHWQEKPKKTFGIALASFFLLICLALQTLWSARHTLAQNIQWRPALEILCAPIDCGLEPLSALHLIRSDRLAVQSHPEFSNALRVKVQFRNDASFEQALPGLLLTFTNANDEVLAQRQFTPLEYLQEELHSLQTMPARSQLDVTLDLLDPGPQALNYEISFYTIASQ